MSLNKTKAELNRSGKTTTSKSIPPKLLKSSKNSCPEKVKTIFYNCLIKTKLPNELKLESVTLKRKTPIGLRNAGLVVVYLVFKTFFWKNPPQGGMFKCWSVLSPFMYGYKKGFRTQQALWLLKERWKNTFDKNGYGEAILMDLSKAFVTINPYIWIAKPGGFSFDIESLKVLLLD